MGIWAATQKGRWRRVVAVMMLACAVQLAGCNMIRQLLPSTKIAQDTNLRQQQLQARTMRYADEHVGRVVEESGRFRRSLEDPQFRYLITGWTLSQANSAHSSAAGETPIVNALDLVTLAVLSRMVIEDTLVPAYPEQGQALLATHRHLEAQAWTICDEFLTPQQIEEFRSVLVEWRRKNPKVSSVAFIHFLDFAKQVGRPRVDGAIARGQSLVDYLFLRAAALIVLLVGTVFGAALLYRRLGRH